MKIIFFICIFIFSGLTLKSMFNNKLDWDFIINTGGFSFEEPIINEGIYVLPVMYNISGLKKITTDPQLVNSALSIKGVNVKISDNNIYIYIVKTVISKKHPNIELTEIPLGKIAKGKYNLIYSSNKKESIIIGTVNID